MLAGVLGSDEGPGAGTPASLAGEAGVGLTRSSTLPVLAASGREEPVNDKPRVHKKNTVAKTAVVRDKKLAPPVAPNKLPELPEPNAAPMSAPLPCCISTSPIMANAERI